MACTSSTSDLTLDSREHRGPDSAETLLADPVAAQVLGGHRISSGETNPLRPSRVSQQPER